MKSFLRLALCSLVCALALANRASAQDQTLEAAPLLSSPAPFTPALSSLAFDVPLPRAPISVAKALAQPDLRSGESARHSGDGPSWARFASGTGNDIFLAAGTLLPLIEDGKNGGQHSLRTADALIVSTLIAEGLKRLTHEERPDESDFKSFPSGHATAAFTVATMQSHYHPRQAIFWYAGAVTIAASRVKLHRHYTHDVIAGAALGFFTARFELKQNRGLLLRPFIRPDGARNRVSGLSFDATF